MARIRTVKPEFWRDEKVVSVSRDARLLFIGLLNFANDEGVVKDAPLQLKIDIFPMDNEIGVQEVGNYLDELNNIGMVSRYVANYRGEDRPFLHIRGFNNHQYISNPTSSDLPAPPQIPEQNQPSQECSEKIQNTLEKSGGLLPGKEGKGIGKDKERIKALSDRTPYQELLDLWNEHRPKGLPGAKGLNDKRRQYMRNGWAGFPDMDHWRKVFKNQATNSHRMGVNDRGWKASIDFVFREWLRMAEELPEITTPPVAPGLIPRDTVIAPGKPDCPECGGKGYLTATRMGLDIRRQCPCTEQSEYAGAM